MSEQTPASYQQPVRTSQPGGSARALRVLALSAVCLGVAALAAATFVLSYAGIHVLALQAGVAARLARGYPVLIDAMLVIVLAAVLALRGAGLPSRLLAWLTLLAVLAAAAGADALHAAGRKLPAQAAAITVAVVPWALVFLGFALLLAMLRHARLRRLAAARGQPPQVQAQQAPNGPALDLPARRQPPTVPSIVPGFAARPTQPGQSQETAAPQSGPLPEPGPDGSVPTEPAPVGSEPALTEPVPAGAVPDGAVPDDAGPGAAVPDDAGPGAAVPTESQASAGPGEPYPTGRQVPAVPRQPGRSSVADADSGFAGQGEEPEELAGGAEPWPSEPSRDETASDPAAGALPDPAAGALPDPAAGALPDPAHGALPDPLGRAEGLLSPVPTAAADELPDPDMPVFHRMWSSPTPPAGM
jgi:Protein of unknown function (DUF2637)